MDSTIGARVEKAAHPAVSPEYHSPPNPPLSEVVKRGFTGILMILKVVFKKKMRYIFMTVD